MKKSKKRTDIERLEDIIEQIILLKNTQILKKIYFTEMMC